MSQVLRFNTNCSLDVIDIDFNREATIVNREISKLINCDYYTTFKPFFLLELLKLQAYNYDVNKTGLLLLLDDDAPFKQNLDLNDFASVFAGSDVYGDCLLVGTKFRPEYEDFELCSVPEDLRSRLERIYTKFKASNNGEG